jgi:shikimate dehydrogenase
MFENYSGATRIVPVLGHPITQAKSPAGMTKGFAERGADVVVVPIDVPPSGVQAFLKALDQVKNLAGVLATVPHKFALCAHAPSRTSRASFFGSANIMRRGPTGSWHADMLDGLGFVRAIRNAGGSIDGKKSLLIGAGGAGGAIAFELLDAGAAMVAVHDLDHGRRDKLILRLNQEFPGKSEGGTNSPDGFDIIINASPLGMRLDDPLPLEIAELTRSMFVGDVVTAPQETPLLEAANRAGCASCSGHDMFDSTLDLMLDFFLEKA